MTYETTATRMPAWLESAWLARYLDRQLSADETAWFEAYLLDKPDLLAMVETDNNLRDALAAEAVMWRPVASAEVKGGDVRHEVTGPDLRHAANLNSRKHSPAWLGIAAALLLGLSLGWFGDGAWRNDGGAMLVANPPRIVVDTLRGGPMTAHVEHADGDAELCIVEIAVPAGATEIEVRLGDLPLLQSLKPSADGFVGFIVGRSELVANADATVSYRLGDDVRSRRVSLMGKQGATK